MEYVFPVVFGKTPQVFREYYSNMLISVVSWDFAGCLKDNKEKGHLDELDLKRTVILDYTADNNSSTSYSDWGLLNNLQWIFGVIHSFTYNSDILAGYKNIIAPCLQEASADNTCIGLLIRSEILHSNTYLLKYVADKSWHTKTLKLEKVTECYYDSPCPTEIAKTIKSLWNSFFALSQCSNWGRVGASVCEPQFSVLSSGNPNNFTHGNE